MKLNTKLMKIVIVLFILATVVLLGLNLHVIERFTPIRPSKRTVEPYNGQIRKDQSIFVSVASYRDRMCLQTVKDMIAKAKRPELVFVGVVQQNKYDPTDAQVNEREDCTSVDHPNMRVMTLDYTEARGPCYARYLCAGLYRGETYFLQIDSHTTFVQDWDDKLVRMMRDVGPNGVLSYYPNADTDADKNFISFIGNVNMNTDPNMPVFGAETNTTGQLKRSIGVAGGFMAMRGQVLKRVPFDPSLDNLFMGEELLYAARLFTHGLDMYSPPEHLAFHFYTRADEPKYSIDLKAFHNKTDTDPKQRVYEILGLKGRSPEFGKYSLGKQRPIQSYFDWIKLNPKTLTVTS
jgi:hypothetical protein